MASLLFSYTAQPLASFCGLWQETSESRQESATLVLQRYMALRRAAGLNSLGGDYNDYVRLVLGAPGLLGISYNGSDGFSIKRGLGEPVSLPVNVGTQHVGGELITSSVDTSALLIHTQHLTAPRFETRRRFKRDNDALLEHFEEQRHEGSFAVARRYHRVMSDLERATLPFFGGKWIPTLSQHGVPSEAQLSVFEFMGVPRDVAARRLADEMTELGARWLVTCGPDEVLLASINDAGAYRGTPWRATLMQESATAWFTALEASSPLCLVNSEEHRICFVMHPFAGVSLQLTQSLIGKNEIRQSTTVYRGQERSPVVERTLLRWDEDHSAPFTMERSSARRVGIFWDLENMSVPHDIDPARLVARLREVCVPPGAAVVTFKAFFNARALSDRVTIRLGNAGVDMCHVAAPDKNGADIRIIQGANDFVSDHVGHPIVLVVISSDVNFLPLAQSMRRRPHVSTMLVHSRNASADLVGAFSLARDWTSVAFNAGLR